MYGEVTLMELAPVIAIIAVVLVVQIITLVQIAAMRKEIRALKEIKVAPPAPSVDRFEKKGGDFRRHEKRPYPDQRPRPSSQNQPTAPAVTPPAAAATANPVETSLRDINLRLKNAERDQDFARKKIQENLGDRDQNNRGHDRGNDRNRDGGDRNRGGRDGGRDGSRDRNRNPRRDNWQDRNSRPAPQPMQQPATVSSAPNTGDEPASTFERTPPVFNAPVTNTPVEQMAPVSSVASSPAPVVVAIPPVQDSAPADFSGSDEGFEHGRKVFVKRRSLRDEGSENTETASADMQASSKESDVSENTEIQFGRRKG